MEVKNDKVIYGYIISPGNNSTAIENALKKRNVWQSLSADKDLLSASFLWKQLNYSAKVYQDFEQVLKCYPSKHVLLNHYENNHVITTKSGLLKTLKYYYSHQLALIDKSCHVHDVIPTSFIIHAHKDDTQYKDFVEKFNQLEKKNYHKEKVPEKHCEKNVWFIKPEADNQGKGIILSNNFKEIQAFLVSKPVNSGWIVQKAIQKPMLYHGRKFDVRVWVLVTPQFEIFYYNTPYMRTTSIPYTTEALNSQIHLTNNCQQKHFSEYSKFQQGNTIPMRETLLKYIDTIPGYEGRAQQIVEQSIKRMKQLIIDTLLSARKYFVKGSRKKQFELFGYDFLFDEDFRIWLLQVNNNPYLGVPNTFIKELLPLMIDEMIQIVVDPLFPPDNYTPVQEKKFQLIYKESTSFRISPVRIMSSSNDNKYIPKRDKSYSKQKSLAAERIVTKSQVYNIGTGKQEKVIKPIYSTPAQSIKYLLDNYCFNDLDPFITPVNLLLNSTSLADEQLIEVNIKKLKLISQTRIAKILLQPKIFDLGCNIIGQDKFNQKIKLYIVNGFTNACKTFKAKIFIIRNLLPLVCQNLRFYKQDIEEPYLQAIVKLLISSGGYFDRSVFIPGQSRENQFVRELFIKSNTLKLLLYLKKKYAKLCTNQLNAFVDNLSEKDWELFYQISGNKAKRCYSPKVNTAPENEQQSISINTNAMNQDKPRVLTIRQNAQIKNFRTRRHSGIGALKKQ